MNWKRKQSRHLREYMIIVEWRKNDNQRDRKEARDQQQGAGKALRDPDPDG